MVPWLKVFDAKAEFLSSVPWGQKKESATLSCPLTLRVHLYTAELMHMHTHKQVWFKRF